jgi:guanine nucleotide-binding protein subunit alpha
MDSPRQFREDFSLHCLTICHSISRSSLINCAYTNFIHYTSYMENLHRLFSNDYIPSDQDVLRFESRSTGITETVLELGGLTYHIIDVGGQRSERKKWIHCFENVTCLLFIVSLSGYDQCLVEDKNAVHITPT